MKTKLAMIVIVIIIIGFLFFITFFKNQDSEISKTISPEEITGENIVIYTNSGYSPSELTVSAGTAVSFINQSDSPMWTASDPHPIHTDFAQFDQRKGISKDGVYKFIFEKSGTYNYHNHLSPRHKGTIKVE